MTKAILMWIFRWQLIGVPHPEGPSSTLLGIVLQTMFWRNCYGQKFEEIELCSITRTCSRHSLLIETKSCLVSCGLSITFRSRFVPSSLLYKTSRLWFLSYFCVLLLLTVLYILMFQQRFINICIYVVRAFLKTKSLC